MERLSLLLAEVTGGERGGAVLCELERELRAEQASLHRLCRSVDTVSVRRVAAWPHNKLQTKLQVYRVSHIGTEVSTQFLCFQYREHRLTLSYYKRPLGWVASTALSKCLSLIGWLNNSLSVVVLYRICWRRWRPTRRS